jgi:tyrosyl-tRNA synthetase
MSKSLDNYVAIEEPPDDMYGKLMSIPDDLMMDYFELLTDVPDAELAEFRQQISAGSVNPMTLKKRLAAEIVGEFHSAGAAGAAESAFERVVQAKEAPEEIPECRVSLVELAAGPSAGTTNMGRSDSVTVQASDLLLRTGMAESRGEAKRLITQGAVEVDGRRISGTTADVRDGSVLKVGKRRWVRIVDADAQG